MSRSPSARLRGAATVVVLLAGASPLRAQERPADPPARNTATDTLESARDEIRGLKVGREARGASEGSLPRIAAPEWHGGTVPTPPVSPARSNPAADAANPNWLVDALRKPDSPVLARDRASTRADRPGAPAASGRSEETRDRMGLAPAESRGDSERRLAGPRTSGAGASTNPLTAYLDDWMTPQDFALLKPGLEGRAAAVMLPPDFGPMPEGLKAGMSSAPGHAPGTHAAPVAPAGGSRGVARENPFLSALNAPAAAPPRFSAPAPGPAPVPPSIASPPSPAPAPRIPDFVRPGADEKHFKPLKRF